MHDEIEGLTDTAAIQELMSRVSAGNKPFKGIEPTLTETENDMANENKTQGFEYGAIAASLGMKDGEVKDVMARISELAAMEPKYREIQKSLSDAQTVIAGKDASIRNLQTDLAAATGTPFRLRAEREGRAGFPYRDIGGECHCRRQD